MDLQPLNIITIGLHVLPGKKKIEFMIVIIYIHFSFRS